MRSFWTAAVVCGIAAAQAPSADTVKQVLTNRLMALKPAAARERNVVFQVLRPGSFDGGAFKFRATVLVRDYDAGYPPNRYYGRTCVGKLDGEFAMSPDGGGGWRVEGAMTPPMDKTMCQNNPDAGVSSIPLATLQGVVATANAVAVVAPAGHATTAAAAPADAGAVRVGSYECWANGEARMPMNFTIRNATQYVDSEGKVGTYAVNGGRIAFRGGVLDGVFPAGFYSTYEIYMGRPKVSFRNSGGSEIQYCGWVK